MRTPQALTVLCYGLVFACCVRDGLQKAARVGRSPRWITSTLLDRCECLATAGYAECRQGLVSVGSTLV
jgi:hypothetical protein